MADPKKIPDDENPDDNTRVVRAVETIIGGKLVNPEDNVFGDDAEMERRYREIMRRGRVKKRR